MRLPRIQSDQDVTNRPGNGLHFCPIPDTYFFGDANGVTTAVAEAKEDGRTQKLPTKNWLDRMAELLIDLSVVHYTHPQ
jgi:hypothetical protein